MPNYGELDLQRLFNSLHFYSYQFKYGKNLNFVHDKTIDLQTFTYIQLVKLKRLLHITFTALICLVWFINGLFCKVLDLVPRHRLIVSEILGDEYASFFTFAIGMAEMFMVVWILSGVSARFCAIFQMTIIGTMNIIEFTSVPHLLLFGKLNIVFASLFIVLIYINEFVLKDKQSRKQVHKSFTNV
jgi:hypothetical protein